MTTITYKMVLDEYIECYHMALWQRDFETGQKALEGIDRLNPGKYFTEWHSNWFDKAKSILDRFMPAPKNRQSKEYVEFRVAVLERDKWKCTECSASKDLNVHHIERYRDNKAKATDIDNGITLCVECHKKEHRLNGR